MKEKKKKKNPTEEFLTCKVQTESVAEKIAPIADQTGENRTNKLILAL